MSGLDPMRLELGRRGSVERRVAERLAIIDAHLALALGSAKAELDSGWIGPEHSPLGRDKHVEAVERRLARWRQRPGAHMDATIVAGRHLLTLDALADELFRPERGSGRLECALRALSRHPARNDNAGARR